MTDKNTGPVDAGQRDKVTESAGPAPIERALRVAIVGSGPSGFYAAEALLHSVKHVQVHLFERLPVPFGLVRYGVAPDHGKIRKVVVKYNKIAANPNVRFWGNVRVGVDLTVTELGYYYDAIIYAYGSESDRQLGIPGEDLPHSYTATDFCAWYNGHPDYRHYEFDLSHENVAVIGQGNVAIDVARVLVKPTDELAKTDIAAHALEALSKSKVNTVYCIGRRGPAQAAFTTKEIIELDKTHGCDLIVDPADLELGTACQMEAEMTDRPGVAKNLKALGKIAARGATGAEKRVVMRFFRSPVELIGEDSVDHIKLVRNKLEGDPGSQRAVPTEETETLECTAVFRSVGYRGVKIEGVPFDEKRGVIPNEGGRVRIGVYAAGWIKRGPSGLIGTNKKDSEETVEKLVEDIPALTPAAIPDDKKLEALLIERGVRVVRYADWH
ncbi:MAG: FAD-dependent oxidoreductase, partial [Planctomycetota bacterium]